MSLIIEDGSVVPNADSYISLTDARELATKRNLTLSEDDATAEGQLRNGYLWLIDTYEPNMQGSRVSAEQTGCFPRTGVYARDFAVPSDEIPQDIINAQVSMAASIQTGVDVNATKTGSDLAGFSVGKGAYSETYNSNSSNSVLAYTPAISRMLKPYMVNGGKLTATREDMRIYPYGRC